MQWFLFISDMIIPMVIFGIVCYGVIRKVDVYDTFIKGANSGFHTVIKIMPTMIALMIAVGILRASGFLEMLSEVIGRVSVYIGFPGELVPLTVVKMFSSSAASGLLLDTYKEYGTDSQIGLIASISMACTETIFYTMSVYFMTAKVKKSRYTLPGALLATLAGLAASVVIARWIQP
ncbi:MAG: spore maturation protein [Eubacteriales bacterium]|nr:spore maturation protein [Eubacteriales bacterium]